MSYDYFIFHAFNNDCFPLTGCLAVKYSWYLTDKLLSKSVHHFLWPQKWLNGAQWNCSPNIFLQFWCHDRAFVTIPFVCFVCVFSHVCLCYNVVLFIHFTRNSSFLTWVRCLVVILYIYLYIYIAEELPQNVAYRFRAATTCLQFFYGSSMENVKNIHFNCSSILWKFKCSQPNMILFNSIFIYFFAPFLSLSR